MRYFLHLGYNGTNYHGWQQQPNVLGIQEVIENALHKILKQKTACHGCGRTDAGVHASQYFLHFDVVEALSEDFLFRLNNALPGDIAAFDVLPMEEKSNAQHDAFLRTYDYYFHFRKNPFMDQFSTFYPFEKPDLEKIKAALSLFATYNDFRSLCLRPDIYKHTICKVYETRLWVSENKAQICFQISANRFLRGMVRLITGRLLDIGRGKLGIDEFENSLIKREALQFNKQAKPQGLYLSKIRYPYLNLESNSVFNVKQQGEKWLLV